MALREPIAKLTTSRRVAFMTSVLVYVLVVAADRASEEVNVGPLYLLPVLFVSWTLGRAAGVALALLCAGTELWFGWILDFEYSTRGFLYLNVLTRFAAYAVVAWIVSALRRLYDKGVDSARRDPLTGAANRTAFYEALSAERARQRRSRKPLSIVYIDCDNFKAVNDDLGHAEGDKVLQAMVETARSKLRETDTVARLGGDEFALILPETDANGAGKAITALRESLTEAMREHGWPVSFSMGLGTFVSLSESLEELVSLSDALMYEAKRQGKNRVVQREYVAAGMAPSVAE